MSEGPEGGKTPEKKEVKKSVSPIPPGFRMVTPYLVAEDGPALLDFAIQAFGAEEKMRATTPRGGVHGEVRIGDSMLMMGGGAAGPEVPRIAASQRTSHLRRGRRRGLQESSGRRRDV